ncbi:hypothetical protein KR054_003415, partial [Drosophila jambulina]
TSMFPGAKVIALTRDLDAISMFYEERSQSHCRKQFKVVQYPRPGQSFVFHGMISLACEHFSINFLSKQPDQLYDVLLQVGARLPQNYITRNSRIRGMWGPEENSSNLRFQLSRGKSFWMQILLTQDVFLIAVNGYHFASYTHRLPYRWLEAVTVVGDVSDLVISSHWVSEYPVRLTHSMPKTLRVIFDDKTVRYTIDDNGEGELVENVGEILEENDSFFLSGGVSNKEFLFHKGIPLPFYGKVPKGFPLDEGNTLRIEGRVCLMPQSFSVALQKGQQIWPQPTVSFYFSPVFLRSKRDKIGKAVIKRGAYHNGNWVNCQETRLNTTLRPGGAFVIMIVCRKYYYELFLNTKLILQFKRQMNPAVVDIVNIRGDMKLWDVVIEDNKDRPKVK